MIFHPASSPLHLPIQPSSFTSPSHTPLLFLLPCLTPLPTNSPSRRFPLASSLPSPSALSGTPKPLLLTPPEYGMLALEFLPISTLLAVLTTEIIETALAAQDVLMEKETFKMLSTYFSGIQPVLIDLQNRDMKETPAARQALQGLRQDISKAKTLIDMCGKRSRFYQLVNCRSIVKEAQQITRDVGKSLSLLSLASAEVSMDIQNNVDKLKDQMMQAEYQASEQKLEIVNKIEMGIRQHKTDQAFLNDLIREIARAVGVPVEDSSEIRKELAYFKKEKEEAALRKEREEEVFMEQIIALLSRADAACTPEAIREDYRGRRYLANVDKEQEPLHAFRCPLSGEIMKDPVSVSTGSTFERTEIEAWFASGRTIDPVSKTELIDLSLKPNHKIRECIEEWVDMNHCIRIQIARRKLESGEEDKIKEALDDLCKLCDASYKIRHWIAEEELVKLIVQLLKSGESSVKLKSLSTLQIIVSENDDNKNQLVQAGGVELLVRCLAKNVKVSKLAVALLVELLQPQLSRISSHASIVLEKLSHEVGAILLLVTICNGVDIEAAENAEKILKKLSDEDENVVEMAKVNWFVPLLERLEQGSEQSKLVMAKVLGYLKLTEQSLETLGSDGAITSLIQMMTGNLEYKLAALCALQNLVSHGPNRRRLAQTGAVPMILEHLFAVRYPSNVREAAAAILHKLVLDDGCAYLVDENGYALGLPETIRYILTAIQDSFSSPRTIQKHMLFALFGLMRPPHAHEARKVFKDLDGVTMLLPYLEHGESEIRNAVVQVLWSISTESANEICLFVTSKKLTGLFARLLDDDVQTEVQTAAAGILSCIPHEETSVTLELLDNNVLPLLLHHIQQGDPKLKETAIGTLLRFTLSSNIEMQRKVVELGVFSVLRGLLNSGTAIAKLKAAIALRNFSESTMQLSTPQTSTTCFCFTRNHSRVCQVHSGECGEKTTFCLVQAGVISDLVLLLRDKESDAAGASLDALSTLVPQNENLEKGVMLLHQENAIKPILGLLSHGTDFSKEKAVTILRKVFRIKAMREEYGNQAQIPLVDLATHGNDLVSKQAANVLATIQHQGSSILFWR